MTEKRAAELSRKSIGSPERDAGSGSMRFEYRDENNVKHTVWYAGSCHVERMDRNRAASGLL
ncbi:hypothetical protein [Paenibacillus sp. MBLB4367]|uniref:hypothetical protein n=1 Tax=Paenibacillus sp. MBLB4367 TaxID=3384767 RepID=UPI003908065D